MIAFFWLLFYRTPEVLIWFSKSFLFCFTSAFRSIIKPGEFGANQDELTSWLPYCQPLNRIWPTTRGGIGRPPDLLHLGPGLPYPSLVPLHTFPETVRG